MKRETNKKIRLLGKRSPLKLLFVSWPYHFVLGLEVQWGEKYSHMPHEDGWIVFAINIGPWSLAVVHDRGDRLPTRTP